MRKIYLPASDSGAAVLHRLTNEFKVNVAASNVVLLNSLNEEVQFDTVYEYYMTERMRCANAVRLYLGLSSIDEAGTAQSEAAWLAPLNKFYFLSTT